MRRIIASSSNWTGRPVFCCTTIARVRIRPPLTRSPTQIFTTSQPRSLLSMARSNSTRSRSRRSRSSQKRIAQTCCGFSALLAPSFRPAFQARRSREAGSYSECPIIVLLSALVGQRELRWMQWRFSLAETGQPLWNAPSTSRRSFRGIANRSHRPKWDPQMFLSSGLKTARTATAQIVD